MPPGVRLDAHPAARTIASLEAYRADVSKACLGCHQVEDLSRKANHAAVSSSRTSGSPARSATVSHGVRAVAAWKQAADVNEYCLRCHAKLPRRCVAGGNAVRARDRRRAAQGLGAPQHACIDCHTGFSKSAHAIGAPATSRTARLPRPAPAPAATATR